VSTWGSDIGGFFALGTRRLTPELLKRWVQFGAVSGVMRTQAEGIAVPPKERPQVWDDDQLGNWRRYAKLRTQLHPYLVAADARYRRSGLPMMAHLALEWPGDRRAGGRDDQFMFGPDLLAAPVLEPGARSRRLYLPRGDWVNLWRAVRYDERSGGLRLRRARAVPGGRTVDVRAPLRELPLLARAGAVLPLLPPDVDTLAGYGAGRAGLVRLADRRDQMELLAFPRGTRTSHFNEGERVRSVEGRGAWTLRVRGGRTRTYRLQASLATLRRPFVPCEVRVGGRALPASAWSYDRQTRRLRATFSARDARVRVAACPPSRRGPRFTG
jgi:hypothetical protein